MVLPLASWHVAKVTAVTPLGTTVMLSIPQDRQGSKMGKSGPVGGYSWPQVAPGQV